LHPGVLSAHKELHGYIDLPKRPDIVYPIGTERIRCLRYVKRLMFGVADDESNNLALNGRLLLAADGNCAPGM
jgi:hypothetical protein